MMLPPAPARLSFSPAHVASHALKHLQSRSRASSPASFGRSPSRATVLPGDVNQPVAHSEPFLGPIRSNTSSRQMERPTHSSAGFRHTDHFSASSNAVQRTSFDPNSSKNLSSYPNSYQAQGGPNDYYSSENQIRPQSAAPAFSYSSAGQSQGHGQSQSYQYHQDHGQIHVSAQGSLRQPFLSSQQGGSYVQSSTPASPGNGRTTSVRSSSSRQPHPSETQAGYFRSSTSTPRPNLQAFAYEGPSQSPRNRSTGTRGSFIPHSLQSGSGSLNFPQGSFRGGSSRAQFR
ncbi:hypothetical protein T439DRAFT_171347 [Meredithblackwellia eburnea MCA 4105]